MSGDLGHAANDNTGMGARIRDLRLSWGETVDEVAGYLGRAPNYICRIERGKVKPSDLTVARLAQRWVVSPEYLRGEPGAEKDPQRVRVIKARLRRYLLKREPELGIWTMMGPRVRIVLRYLMKAAPSVYTRELLGRWLMRSPREVQEILETDGFVHEYVIYQVSQLSGVPHRWFWQLDADLLQAEAEPERPFRLSVDIRWPLLW